MHTVKVIAGGFALLALCLLIGRLVFLVVFAVPAAVALLMAWKLSRG